jgi:hypothetical protein
VIRWKDKPAVFSRTLMCAIIVSGLVILYEVVSHGEVSGGKQLRVERLSQLMQDIIIHSSPDIQNYSLMFCSSTTQWTVDVNNGAPLERVRNATLFFSPAIIEILRKSMKCSNLDRLWHSVGNVQRFLTCEYIHKATVTRSSRWTSSISEISECTRKNGRHNRVVAARWRSW